MCDVFGTAHEVRKYRLRLDRQRLLDVTDDEDMWSPVVDIILDLSPRAALRLDKFLSRGITPPTPAKGSDAK